PVFYTLVAHRHYHLTVRTGQHGRDRDDGWIDVRKFADREPRVTDDAEQDECGGNHAGQDRSADRRLRESHRARKLTEKGDPGRARVSGNGRLAPHHRLTVRRFCLPDSDITSIPATGFTPGGGLTKVL